MSRRADLLERSLRGLPCTDDQVQSLVATAGQIPALTSPACGPRAEFVSALGLQLRAAARTSAAGAPSTSSATSAPGSTRPRVFIVGRGVPRALAGATACLLLIGALLGVVSRSALPGGLLYPVKEVLNSAAVHLAGSDLNRGVTLLSQAQEDIHDARALIKPDGARANPASVDQALLNASNGVNAASQTLIGEFARTGDPHSLIMLQDFAVRALPQLTALRSLVPAASKPDLDALVALLHQTRARLALQIAVCGQPCSSLGGLGAGTSPASPSTNAPFASTTGGPPKPGLRTPRGLPVVGSKTGTTTARAAMVGPAAHPLAITSGDNGGAILPPVTVGSITVSAHPLVAPRLPLLNPGTGADSTATPLPSLP